MNNSPLHHPIYERHKERLQMQEKANVYLHWLDNTGRYKDPTPDAPEPDDLNNPSSRPGISTYCCAAYNLLMLVQL